MLRERLKDYHIVLASGSPRRKELLMGLDIDFDVQTRPVDESYPVSLEGADITDYLARLKAAAFERVAGNQVIITADTIVWSNGRALNKPGNEAEAIAMLEELSGNQHQVITSVCFKGAHFEKTINDTTSVRFREMDRDELSYYVELYRPYDKAGSYGIQEWIGFVGIEKIEGCYFNVMGLPTRLVYKTLMQLDSLA
jgi:septum formation protein